MSRTFRVEHHGIILPTYAVWELVNGKTNGGFADFTALWREQLAERMGVDVSYIPFGPGPYAKIITIPNDC